MQKYVRSPHRIDLLTRWLKEHVEHDEGEGWRQWLGERARNPLWLPGRRGFWGYRREANGEHRFSVSDVLPSPEASDDVWWWWIFHPDAALGGSLIMSPAPDNSTDIALDGCTDQWQPYFGMLLEEMERPNLAVAVGGEKSEEATEQQRQPGLADRPSWLPKKPETRGRWQEAYDYMCDLDEEYKDRWHDFGDNPEPKRADYADYLAQQMRWRPCEKTIGRIKRAGKERWL